LNHYAAGSKASGLIPDEIGGAQDCETSRLPHFLDSRLLAGGEIVSLTLRTAALYPQEDSWYSFLLEAGSAPGRYATSRKVADSTNDEVTDLFEFT
jgi:hypothetical protein